MVIPASTAVTDAPMAIHKALRKLGAIRSAVTAGMTMSAEVSRTPTTRMATTTVIAARNVTRRFGAPTGTPWTRAASSSNVRAKSSL